MDGLIFGNLAHEVLERFGRSTEAASSDVRVVEQKVLRILEGTAHEAFGRRPVPAVRVQTEQLRARLRRFAEWQASWVSEGWRVVRVEVQPEPGVPFEVDGKPILLRGKIDRIDQNAETGRWAIFDYKTGDAGLEPEKTHRKGPKNAKVWVDLQLPLYRTLLAGITDENGAPVVPAPEQAGVGLGYIRLPKKLAEVGCAFAPWTPEQLEEAEETARRVVRELRRGEFSFDSGVRGFRDDPFDALLGRLELPTDDERAEEGEG